MGRPRGVCVLGAILVLAAACVAPRGVPVAAPASCPGAATPAVLSTLFFGMASRDGRGVSEQAWDRFLETVVTPRFPDGLTVLPGHGQYRGPGSAAIVREPAKVVLILHGGTPPEHEAIREIRAAYARSFDQEAVLHLAGPTCAGPP